MNDDKIRVRTAAYAVLVTALCGGAATAQDGQDASGDADKASVAKACLDNPTIKRTRILNDRNIVFITRDNEIYNNQLPRQCPSLRRGSLVNYAISNRQVCAGGQFQVLWETGAGNFTPAFTCQLGIFVPITEAELEDLTTMTDEDRDRRRARRRSTREAVTSEQVDASKSSCHRAQARRRQRHRRSSPRLSFQKRDGGHRCPPSARTLTICD